MEDIKILWETNVGSHMWGMARPESDFDIYRAYIVPTNDILMGTSRQNSHQTVEGNIDRASHEIGVIIKQLLLGNINHLWGTMSPIILRQNDHWLERLREIVRRNQSKNIFHSTNGMAFHNHKKYVLNRQMEDPLLEKKCNTVVRSLNFGIALLQGKGFRFDEVKGCIVDDIRSKMVELEVAYKNSTLPDGPPNPIEFRQYLLGLRMAELRGEL